MRYFFKRNVGYFTALLFAVLGFVDYKNLLVLCWPSVDFFKELSLIRTSADLIYFWTLLAIILYVREMQRSTKFLEYQIRPKSYPLLITERQLWPIDGAKSKRVVFVVINPDNFKALFYARITVISSGQILADRWEGNPLHVYPGGMQYPEVFDISKLSSYEKDETVVKIEYKIAASNAPAQIFNDYQEEIWKFTFSKRDSCWTWEGPNHIGVGVVRRLLEANRGSKS